MSHEFNVYENWQRNPTGDQPRLVGANDSAIEPQIGFITPEGTEIQMSYRRARELGMVEPLIIPTERIDEYGKRKLEEHGL